jgi:hypothetical protein
MRLRRKKDNNFEFIQNQISYIDKRLDKLDELVGEITLRERADGNFTIHTEMDKFVAKSVLMNRRYMGLTDFKEVKPTEEEFKFAQALYLKSLEGKK